MRESQRKGVNNVNSKKATNCMVGEDEHGHLNEALLRQQLAIIRAAAHGPLHCTSELVRHGSSSTVIAVMPYRWRHLIRVSSPLF